MRLPVVKFAHLFHVGNLDGDRGQVNGSHEGCLLSVSIHPEEWIEIARLGGQSTYRLEASSDLRLLNYRRLSEATRTKLLEVASAAGLISPVTLWKAWSFDEENQEWSYSLCDSEPEARAESEPYADEDDFPGVEEANMWVAEPTLAAYWQSRQKQRTSPISAFFVPDAAISYIVEHCTDLDGVWWADDFDPARLSAPRGGLFQRVLPGLTRVEDADPNEFPEMGIGTSKIDLSKIPAAAEPSPLSI